MNSPTRGTRLSELEKDEIELKLYNVFKEIDINSLVNDLERLKTFKQEIHELHQVLEATKCICEKLCKRNSLFCC